MSEDRKSDHWLRGTGALLAGLLTVIVLSLGVDVVLHTTGFIMNENHGSGNWLRGTGAVLAGLLTVFALSIGIDVGMHSSGVFPPWGEPMSDGLFLFAFLYRCAIEVLGGYVTARLAPARPMRYALILGVVGLVLSIAGAAATWDKGPAFGPKWYPLALVASAIPCSWLGAKLLAKQSRLQATTL
jgi:hypothetical protein